MLLVRRKKVVVNLGKEKGGATTKSIKQGPWKATRLRQMAEWTDGLSEVGSPRIGSVAGPG